MPKYIVKNCPAFVQKLFSGNEMFQDICCRHAYANKFCKDVTDCQIKKLINGVKLEYKTPEQLNRYERLRSDLNYGAICGKHNMAHLVLTSLGVEEVGNEN